MHTALYIMSTVTLVTFMFGITILALIAIFQLLTAPVSAHMVGRAAFRTGLARREQMTQCEFDADGEWDTADDGGPVGPTR